MIDHGTATVPTHLLDDWLIPAAVILTGGAFLAGRGRTIILAIYLPVSILLARLWLLLSPIRRPDPLGVLILVVAGCHLSWMWKLNSRQWWSWPAPLLTTGGMFLAFASVLAPKTSVAVVIQWAGLGVWGAGIVAMGISIWITRKVVARASCP